MNYSNSWIQFGNNICGRYGNKETVKPKIEEWRNVKDELPMINEEYLVCGVVYSGKSPTAYRRVMKYKDTGWDTSFNPMASVVAWMPLPEFPDFEVN